MLILLQADLLLLLPGNSHFNLLYHQVVSVCFYKYAFIENKHTSYSFKIQLPAFKKTNKQLTYTFSNVALDKICEQLKLIGRYLTKLVLSE